ncbi:motility associated factor glycosyltransferase family protein, partial [Campylobacter jejuni]|nr:motility associated factor glycosyltransferase family protein [Campylobacter jejuni]
LERDDIVSKCFDNDFKEFDQGILFIISSVVHQEVIDFLEKNSRKYILVHRPLHFAVSLNLKEFGYIGVGASVANMAYELAASLRHENIILIGQDLAYAKDGSSHPKEHIFGNEGEKIRGEVYTLAYGGEKQVRTQLTWNLFRQAFEKDIFWAKEKLKINTYNCTEGGARIEGTIEKPFKEMCETLLKNNLNKNFPKIVPLSSHKQNELLLKCYYKIIKSINHCKTFKKELLKSYNHIQESFSNLNLISNLDEGKEILNYLIQEIDKTKFKLEDEKMLDLYEILNPILTQFELNLARIYVLNPKTSEDSYNKSLLWVKEHIEFFIMIYTHIKAQEKALIKNITPLENELTQRNLEKYKRKINAKYNF